MSFGQYYVLPLDAKLNDRRQQIVKAQADWDSLNRRRSLALADIDKAETFISNLYRQEGIVVLDTPGVPSANSPHVNQKAARANQARPYEDDLSRQLIALKKVPFPNAPSSSILSLADEMDAAAAQYAVLAADPQVTAAITAMKASGRHMSLGPTSRFNETLERIHNQRAHIRLCVIQGKAAGLSLRVDATVDGKTSLPMLVDPSAPFVLITADASRQTGFVSNPDDRVYLLTAEGTPVKAERGTIKSLSVGSFTAQNVAAAMIPEHTATKDCLLGATFLQQFSYEFDVQAGELRIAALTGGISGDGKSPPATTPASR